MRREVTMNDEFVISKTVSIGSEESSIVEYWLDFERHGMSIEEMSLDEIERLAIFLSEYVKREKGGDHE